MFLKLLLAGVLIILLTSVCSAGVRAAEATLTSVSLTPRGETVLPLAQDRALIPGPDGKRVEVPVLLTLRSFDAELVVTVGGQARPWSGPVEFYELKSTDPAIPFVWTQCATWPLERAALLRHAGGAASYLALSSSTRAFFVEVAAPRDQATALADWVLHRDLTRIVLVPVIEQLGLMDELLGPKPPAASAIEITSVAGGPGNWTVGVTNPISGAAATLTGDGKTFEGTWRRL